MIAACAYLALYAAVVWWLRDGGRTPVVAITLDKTGRVMGRLAGALFTASLEFQLAARAAIEKSRYV